MTCFKRPGTHKGAAKVQALRRLMAAAICGLFFLTIFSASVQAADSRLIEIPLAMETGCSSILNNYSLLTITAVTTSVLTEDGQPKGRVGCGAEEAAIRSDEKAVDAGKTEAPSETKAGTSRASFRLIFLLAGGLVVLTGIMIIVIVFVLKKFKNMG